MYIDLGSLPHLIRVRRRLPLGRFRRRLTLRRTDLLRRRSHGLCFLAASLALLFVVPFRPRALNRRSSITDRRRSFARRLRLGKIMRDDFLRQPYVTLRPARAHVIKERWLPV